MATFAVYVQVPGATGNGNFRRGWVIYTSEPGESEVAPAAFITDDAGDKYDRAGTLRRAFPGAVIAGPNEPLSITAGAWKEFRALEKRSQR
jgi:hypothetical protein